MDEETYRRYKDLFGPDDPNTLSARTTSPIDLRLVGDCFRARDLDRETLAYRQVVLGPDHPYTLHSASMLARDMREAGDYAGSVELLQETYERYLAVLGEDFVDTLRTGKSLAVSLRKMGRLDEAYALTEGHRRPVRADLRAESPGRARLQAEPRLRPVRPRREGGRPRGREPRCSRSYEGRIGGDAPVHPGGGEQHLDLPARHRLGAGRARPRRPDADRAARLARRRPPVHPVVRRSTRRTACTTWDG